MGQVFDSQQWTGEWDSAAPDPAPVVADVRRAPVDLTAMRRKLDTYGVFSLADAELLLAEVARLTAERDQARREIEQWIERESACCPEDFGFDEFIAYLRKSRDERVEELSELRVRLQGLESEAQLMQQMSGEFIKAIPVTELAALLATPEEP